MIAVTARVEIADIPAGAEDDSPSSLAWDYGLEVRNFGDKRDGCVQIIVDGRRYAVNAKDLIAAVQNASNTGDD